MGKIAIMLVTLLLLLLPVGCGTEPVSEEDAAQIEVTLREYYEAMSSYDLERLEAVFTEETWKKEGCKISASALFIKDRGIEFGYPSIKSIKIKSDSARVIAQIESRITGVSFTNVGGSANAFAEVETKLTQREDKHYLVRRDEGWEITEPLNIKEDELSLSYAPNSSTKSTCCPK